MKALAKKLAHVLLGDYSVYQVYARPNEGEGAPPRPPAALVPYRVAAVDEAEITRSPDALIRAQAGYAGAGAHAYGCFDGERIVGLCFYWFGERYRTRNFWPLADREAKLVHIVSHPEFRGRGVATLLIMQSSQDLMDKGFCRTYARIWHSNTPSIRAFERAGWKRIALVLEINPLRRRRPLRLRFDSRAAARRD